MVRINNKKNEILITMQGDAEELFQMQKALLTLLQNYRLEQEDNRMGETFYFGIELYKTLSLSQEQQFKGLQSDNDSLLLPDNMGISQRQLLNEALFMLSNPDTKIRQKPNPIHQILQGIKD